MKDRFFFFYNYEARRDARQVPVNRTVPLASLGQGQVKFFARKPDNTVALVTLTQAQLDSLTTGFNNNTQTPTGYALVNVNNFTRNVLANAAARYPANNFRTRRRPEYRRISVQRFRARQVDGAQCAFGL